MRIFRCIMAIAQTVVALLMWKLVIDWRPVVRRATELMENHPESERAIRLHEEITRRALHGLEFAILITVTAAFMWVMFFMPPNRENP